mmetsp:Transcript_4331/g.12872  ORF Transcript_4331/g.12872 Transcript_4331/m.12872 type:complete len:228 (-) Transcript_4331:707-1390(-)
MACSGGKEWKSGEGGGPRARETWRVETRVRQESLARRARRALIDCPPIARSVLPAPLPLRRQQHRLSGCAAAALEHSLHAKVANDTAILVLGVGELKIRLRAGHDLSPDSTVKWTDFLLTTASLPTSKARAKSSLLTTASWLSASLRKKPRTTRYAASSGTTVSQQTTAGTPLRMHAFASSKDSQPLRTTSRIPPAPPPPPPLPPLLRRRRRRRSCLAAAARPCGGL